MKVGEKTALPDIVCIFASSSMCCILFWSTAAMRKPQTHSTLYVFPLLIRHNINETLYWLVVSNIFIFHNIWE